MVDRGSSWKKRCIEKKMHDEDEGEDGMDMAEIHEDGYGQAVVADIQYMSLYRSCLCSSVDMTKMNNAIVNATANRPATGMPDGQRIGIVAVDLPLYMFMHLERFL